MQRMQMFHRAHLQAYAFNAFKLFWQAIYLMHEQRIVWLAAFFAFHRIELLKTGNFTLIPPEDTACHTHAQNERISWLGCCAFPPNHAWSQLYTECDQKLWPQSVLDHMQGPKFRC